MARKTASATIALGMVKIPVGIAKASSEDSPDLTTLCDCGGSIKPIAVDADGQQVPPDSDDAVGKVACKDCLTVYPWYNSAPGKGFELGDEMYELSGDEVTEAREREYVQTGNVEKVVPVKRVLLHYAVEGNYYLLPEDEFRDQYGALVAVLNEQDIALLTYVTMRSKTRRYAIVSEGGVLLALQLQDKKALPDLDYGADESMEQQAATMLETMIDDDPSLEDVEGRGIKDLVRERASEPGQREAVEVVAKEV